MQPKLPVSRIHLTDAQRSSVKLPFSNQARIQFFSLKAVGIGSVIFGLTAVGIFSWKGYTRHQIATVQQKNQSVLGESTAALTPLEGDINFNIPAVFGSTVSTQDLIVHGVATFGQGINLNNQDLNIGNGKVTASNVVYGLTAGKGISVSSSQSPTITNTGVTALQGSTGDVSLTAGSGITISGLSISNGDRGSAQKIFSTITVGANSVTAGSNTDTLTFAAGGGINVALDTTSKKITITNTGSNGGYTAYAVLYADATGNTTALTPGTSGYILQSNGSGAAPSWVPSPSLSSLAFSAITTGTNAGNTLTVGNGSTLTTSGTGLINANQLNGQTTALGGALTTNGSLTVSGAYTLTLNLGGATNITLPTSGTLATLAGNETLTNKTIAAASNSISGLTNANLSGTAGITNANLANSSLTVTAGTGLVGGGLVSLGSSVSLSLPQTIATTSTPTFAGLTLNGNLTSLAGNQWKPSSDTTTALQIANAAGTPLINFDTTNSFLKLGTGTSIYSGGTCKGTGVNEACASLHVVTSTGNHNIIFENTGPNLLTLANASGGVPYEWTFNVSANQLGDFSVLDGNGFSPFYIAPNPNWMAIGRGFTAPKAVLHVQGGNTGGNAGLIVNQTGAATNDIIAASASGTTKFIVNNNGNIQLAGNTNFLTTLTSAATATRTITLPDAAGTICLSGQTCGSSGTVGYWQRTASAGYNYLSPSTIADILSIGQTTGLTATGLNVAVNSLGNAAAYVENTSGLGDLFTASSAGVAKFVINNIGNVGIGTTTPQSLLSVGGTAEFGSGDNGIPVAETIRGAAASGSNISGANLTFDASNGTGGNGSGDLIFRTAPGGGTPIAVGDTIENETYGNSAFSFNFTVNSHSNMVMLVGVNMQNSSSVSSITWNGSSAGWTKIGSKTAPNNATTELWYLVNPTSGTHSLVINNNEGAHIFVGAGTFYNVNQTTPIAASNTGSGTTSTATSVSVSTSGSQLVVDAIGNNGNCLGSIGSNQTRIWADTLGPNNLFGGSYKSATGTTTTMSWNVLSSCSWSSVIAAINPLANSTPDTLADRFHITSSGNIGIGTANPNNFLLQVAGNIGPNSTDLYNLGSVTSEWNNLYVKNIVSPSLGGTSGYWQLTNGVLAPTNITNDFAIGGTSTSSATFQIFSNGNATTSGNLTLAGPSPTIGTVNQKTLVLGTSTTGAIALNPNNTTGLLVNNQGNVGIGTTAPTEALDIAGNEHIFNSTNQYGSIYSYTTYLDKSWNTTATFNAAGATFTSGMQNPATSNRININPNGLIGWTYKRPVTINNTGNSSTLTNYVVTFTVDTATPIAAAKMNSNCSDLRFTDTDTVTQLNFWIASGCNTSTTTVYVKIPSITASSNYTIYEYYGNSSATSGSNGRNTFPIFEDMTVTPAGTLHGVATYDSVNQYVTFNTTNGQNGQLDYTYNPGSGFESNYQFYTSGGADAQYWYAYATATQVGAGNATGGYNGEYNEWNGKINVNYANTNLVSLSQGGINNGAWRTAKILHYGTVIQSYLDGTLKTNTTDSVRDQSGNVFGYGAWSGGTGSVHRIRNIYTRPYSSPDPTASVGAEGSFVYSTGLQSWTSETQDAGSGNVYKPNYLTVNYTLDGSDNIIPKFQILASNTGSFSGEETIFPNGTGTFYQNGGTYSITSSTPLNITSQVTTAYRYWKVKAYLDTGSNTTDTPTVTNMRLQDSRPLVLQGTSANGPYVGIGTATPVAKLDINGNLNVATYATISASLALGNLSAPVGVGNLALSGNLGIGTSNPQAMLDVNSLFDVFSTGKIGINTTTPLAMLDLKSTLGTQSIASFSGQTSYAGLVVDNRGVGDLITASSSGLTRFVVTQSGNVGIGTSTPGGPLEVKYATANTSGTTPALILNNPVNGTQTVQYFQINGVNKSEFRSDNVGDLVVEAGNGGHLFLGYNDLATADTYINANGGNVGIGTTTVNASLDFGSATATNKIYLFDNGSDKYGMGVNNSGLQLYAGAGTSTNNIQFGRFDGTTFTEMARIQSNGLGLGTTALTAALDVRANSGTTAIASASGSTAFAAQIVNNNGVGDLFTASSSGVTKFTIANNGNITTTGNTTFNGNLSTTGYATVSASLALGNINAPSGVGNLALSGSLGIGTTTLTQALTVAGNASIYNSANGRGDIFTTANLDKTWNTTATFNTAGTTFSAGMQNPAIGNQLNLKSTLGLAGWQHRKAVTVNNTGNGNTLTNYQVQITTDTATPIAAGKMNSDCSDVRITDSDGSTSLNYWIESGCNTGSTIIWTKIPSITASSNYTIYLYYGNSGATSLSSTNTFIRDVSGVSLAYRFDEASGSTTTDYSGNANTGTYTGTSVVAGQFNNARNFTGNSDVVVTSSNVTLGTSWTEAAWINFPIPATSGGWRSVFVKAGGIYHTLIFDSSGNLGTYPSFWASSGYNTNSLTGWHHIMEVGTGGTSSFYVDGTVVGTASAQAQNQSVGNIGNVTTAQQQQIGKLDEPRIYNVALTQAQITDIAANYGYVTPNYAGHELVRKFSSPEPSTSLGSEVSTYTSGLQSWTSETQDAGSGNVYKPNYLTVNYTLDGSDNIIPKFQILASNTGSFSGEETVYPNGVGTFYQNGTTYSITSGTQLDISSQIINKFRYWRIKAYMDTGATVTDTPVITSIRLQDYQANLSLFANGNVGIGNTNAAFKLDVQDTQSATVAAMIRNLNASTTASGLGIAVGATTPGTSNYFLSFLDGAGRIIGKIQGNGSGGVTYATTGIDFAEYYKKAVKAEPLTAGTVVCLSPNGATTCTTGGNILGVVSDRAGFAGGAEHADDPNYALIGLVGQLPVRVATTSGTIIAGDPITASTNGTAVKATTAGQIIGHALTSSQDSTDGTIMVSVNVSWYDPNFYTSATTGVLGTSAQPLAEPLPLTVSTATISGTLNVLGRTTVTDLGVTGNISAGLLTIDGINDDINTLAGDLKLQSEGLGGIDILHGKVIIDTSGDITTVGTLKAQTVTTDKINISNASTATSTSVLSASAGVVTISAGQTILDVHTNKLTGNSLIFVTPDIPVAIAAKKIDATIFRISLQAASGSDIDVNWWVVN